MPRLNLEHQRKRARALLKSARAQDPEALRRFADAGHSLLSTTPALHDAQRVVAREHGFASWGRLRAHIRSESLRHPFIRSTLVAAAHRALETELSQPLFRDPLARPLAGDVGWSLVEAMRQTSWPGNGALGPDPYLTTEETRRSPFMTPYLHKMEEHGFPPWRFGVDDPEAWLATHGWSAASVVVGAPEANYERWPYFYIPRGTPAIPRTFFTQAWLGSRIRPPAPCSRSSWTPGGSAWRPDSRDRCRAREPPPWREIG